MIKLKTVTAKNFLSIGNATQAINLDRKDLTLVLGENLDLGGDDAGARNGTGKTAILNAVSYGLYGQALTNIKKDNLINRTNGKGMMVTIEFEKDGESYRIERGRKPGIMKFWVGNTEREITDESQGDSRETQTEIEKVLGMSHDMFKHVVALNTYTEPFLSLRANDQRTIIEQLLGITLLSEKAEHLKETAKEVKDSIVREEFRIKAVGDANKRIEEQIENLKRRQTMWVAKHQAEIRELKSAYDELGKIDIESELIAHKDLSEWNQKSKDISDLNKALTRGKLDRNRIEQQIKKLGLEITDLKDHKCYACGQELHDSKYDSVLAEKQEALLAANNQHHFEDSQCNELGSALADIGTLGKQPTVFYNREEDAFEHRSSMASMLTQLLGKEGETDPYAEQIVEMVQQGIEVINYNGINDLNRVKDHQDFLLKLLTNKDSFIRKKIIDQNLSYLNARLGNYLDRIGLPHTVKFNNDLTVSITELGRDLDFDNLSRGERNRLILSLSWSFRDVWENLYQPINLLFIDELIDSGLDISGVENSLAILKKMSREHNKSIWLVSHKDELLSRVNNILRVVKEHGFTTYNTDVEVQ